MWSCFKSRSGFRRWAFIACAGITFHSSFIGILQSRKTLVSRSDWWFLNSALCGWKDHSGMTVLSSVWVDLVSFWSISLNSGLHRLSLCLSPFGKCLFRLGEALLQCLPPSLTLITMAKTFRSSCGHLKGVIEACQWGVFLELILRKGNPLGSGRHPFPQHAQASANVCLRRVHKLEFQLVPGLCCLEHCLARWFWICIGDGACGKCSAAFPVVREESRTRCSTAPCSKRRLRRLGSLYYLSASWTILSRGCPAENGR